MRKSYLDNHYEKAKDILKENGINLDLLLSYHKSKVKENIKKSKKSPVFKTKLNKDIYFRYKFVALSEDIGSKTLLEAFMNYFIEGDDELENLLEKLSGYHIKSFYSSSMRREKKIEFLKKINKIYNIPREWWRKYTDLNNEEFDF